MKIDELKFPESVPMILDTDTFNEIDDQFALIYAIISPEKIDLRGVTAAPFLNERSTSPEDGMLKSYDEIKHILNLMNRSDISVKYGSTAFLANRQTPIKSEAAEFIIEESKRVMREGKKLSVAAIAAITNVASALLIDPTLAERIKVVWLGGHDYTYATTAEFNLRQDIAAAQVLFESGVEIVHVPCKDIASSLILTSKELADNLQGTGIIGKYLQEIFDDYLVTFKVSDKVVWDIAVTSYFTNPDATKWEKIPSPTVAADRSWVMNSIPREIVVARKIDKDQVFSDFFIRLKANAKGLDHV